MMDLTEFRRGLSALFVVVFVPLCCHAQRNGEIERLRMENIYLKQKNDSLRRALNEFERDHVFDLWDSLTGIGDEKEDDGDAYSGFGMSTGAKDMAFQKEVMSTIPFLSLSYDEMFRAYIDQYTIGRRQIMPGILRRYYSHLPLFQETFRRYGVPEQLAALCIVESAVSRKALSPAGAYGMWQLMPETARQYGLRVDGDMDERGDVRKSTDAAARVLRDLKRSLGSWDLAVLAYNCGSGNVRKAIVKSGGAKDVWDIYDLLPSETRAYLPSFVAANYCVFFSDILFPKNP